MPDLGLLFSGISSGLQSGVDAYRQSKQAAQEKALKDRMLKAQLAEHGLIESPEGSYDLTPLEKQNKDLERQYKEAQIGELGAKAHHYLQPNVSEQLSDQLKALQIGELLRKSQEEATTAKPEQAKAASFSQRIEDSEKIFNKLKDQGYDRTSRGQSLYSMAPEFMKPGQLKEQEQAERNFVNAVLRRESGAAISNKEFDSAEKQYFPRVGDTPEVLENKRQNRAATLAGIQAEAGKALGMVKKRQKGLLGSGDSAVASKSGGLIGEAQAGGSPTKSAPVDPTKMTREEKIKYLMGQ